VFVNTKFVGEKAVVNLLCSEGNPKPTLLGFGIITSVVSVGFPDPNKILNDPEVKKRVANLFCTCFIFNKLGVSVDV
jgi:hypothetical protein